MEAGTGDATPALDPNATLNHSAPDAQVKVQNARPTVIPFVSTAARPHAARNDIFAKATILHA